MRIDIPDSLADDIALKIAVAARETITAELESLHESQLLASLRSANLGDEQKVTAYFERTRRVTKRGDGTTEVRITNEALYRGLGLSPARMKAARTALVLAGYLTTGFVAAGAIELRRVRRA